MPKANTCSGDLAGAKSGSLAGAVVGEDTCVITQVWWSRCSIGRNYAIYRANHTGNAYINTCCYSISGAMGLIVAGAAAVMPRVWQHRCIGRAGVLPTQATCYLWCRP
ncbi:unnamed protein product, partial [Meganyctiphanes norvegica]